MINPRIQEPTKIRVQRLFSFSYASIGSKYLNLRKKVGVKFNDLFL